MVSTFRSHPLFQLFLKIRDLVFFSYIFLALFPLVKGIMKFGNENSNFPGFWGPVTASIDWCESNYVVSYYIAEFFNSTSNVFPIISGIFLSIRANQLNVGSMYVIPGLVLCLIGIGSLLFHGTLLFQAQLLDELPMIYLQMLCLYIAIKTEYRCALPKLKWSFIAFSIIYSFLHIHYRYVLVFHIVFGCILAPSIMYPLKFTAGDRYIQKNQIYCYSLFVASFVAWKLDQLYCDQIEHLYLHAFWHIGTALSAIYWYTSVLYIELKHVRLHTHVAIKWKFHVFPHIALTSESVSKKNGIHSNQDGPNKKTQ